MIRHSKGRYYRIILNIMGVNRNGSDGVKYMYASQIKGIFDSVPHYFKDQHTVDKEEFIFSMRWALADVFGGGCEVEEPDDLFAEIV